MKQLLAFLLLTVMLLPCAVLAESNAVPMDEYDDEIEIVPVDDYGDEDEVVIMDDNGSTALPTYQPLIYGAFGEGVAELQLKLAELHYYDGEITGSYGDLTRAAVKAFQSDFSLLQTGEADAETQELLFSTRYRPLRLGCTGEDVRLLQVRLTALGYYSSKLSGTYLPSTQEAVYNFQMCSGEIPTGQADVDTLTLLYSEDAVSYAEGMASLPDVTPAPTALDMLDAAPLTPAPTVEYTKTLRYEDKGTLVKTLQQRLTDLGYYEGNISGNFLGHTRNAVKAFQTQNALKADGVVGEQTWNALFNDPDARSVDDAPKPTPEPTPVPYAITVDVNNQVTTVYGLDENGEYTKVVRQMLCSTGTRSAPSDVGDWVLTGRTARWCYFPKWGGHAQYWTKINESIAFHSVIYSQVDNMALKVSSYKNLGKRASHGCIRLTVADAKWIYYNCGAGVVVTITEDLPADPELRAALKLPGLDYSCMLPIITPAPTAAPEYVSGAKPPMPFKTLKKNSSGEAVYWLQCKLKELGYYNGYVSGTYLGGTVNAVKAFQKANGLTANGTADEKTLRKIYAQELATAAPSPTVSRTPNATPSFTPAPAPTATPAAQ
ncbi:MAG: peptidoglycan-binding protein [Clostridia bacterium]|nr:peptidoglycan-binding protein [Clostridia bacterium]